jgi:hypothetical protein
LYFDKPGWKVGLKEITFESNLQTVVNESMEVWTYYPDFEELESLTLPSVDGTGKYYFVIRLNVPGDDRYKIAVDTSKLVDYREVYLLSIKEITDEHGTKQTIPRRTLLEERTGILSFQGSIKEITWKLEGKRAEKKVLTVVPPPKYYPTVEQLMKSINSQLTLFRNISFKIVKDDLSSYAQLTNLPSHHQVKFKNGMQFVLGFKETHLSENKKADYKVELTRGAFSMFVYCDMVESIMVGDANVPLLRTTHLHTAEQGAIVNHVFNPPMYMKLSKTIVNMIEIDIRTDTGDVFPLSSHGKLIVTLHFVNDGMLHENNISCKYK